jgi:hypothetical protein
MFLLGHILIDRASRIKPEYIFLRLICFSAFVIFVLLLLLFYEVLDGEGLWLGYCSAWQYEETDVDDPSAPQKKVDSFNEVRRGVVDWLIDLSGSASSSFVHFLSPVKFWALAFEILCFSKHVHDL